MSNLQDDYNSFLNNKTQSPPESLDNYITTYVNNDLNPKHLTVYTKLLSIQAFIGIASMAFCPQFSLSLTNDHSFFHYLHNTYGELICMLACGAIFMGSGALLAAFILSQSEIKKIKSSQFLYYMSLSLIAVSLFSFVGTDVYLKLAAYWYAGATLAGITLFQVSGFIKKYSTLSYLSSR